MDILHGALNYEAGRTMGVPVRHLAVTGSEIYYVKYKEEVKVSGEVLQVVGANGQLGQCNVLWTSEAERVLQRGQCMEYYFLCYLSIMFQIKLIIFTLLFVQLTSCYV